MYLCPDFGNFTLGIQKLAQDPNLAHSLPFYQAARAAPAA
jgi:hypothetical protein